MPYTNFVVVGTTGIAALVAQELAKRPGTKVKVLSRSPDKKVENGLEVKQVDYNNASQLQDVLQGAQAVIAAVAGAALATPVQYQLADAAKAAGVSLFVPSEFGNRTHDLKEGPLYHMKTKVQEHLKRIGLDFALFYNGPFPNDIYRSAIGFDFENRKVNIVGAGDHPVPQTTRHDTARFIAHVLTTQEPAALANQAFEFRGDVVTFNEAVKLWQASHDNAPVEVTYTPISEARAIAARGDGITSFIAYLRAEWAESEIATEADTANKLFHDWNPTSVREFLATL
ncbi:hypothetical protein OIV83_001767 [Microbotryomycetes sp. JL201]|nr:hypothetical protein OIV83_001767 [Microbotryomycetes sp. JL201]